MNLDPGERGRRGAARPGQFPQALRREMELLNVVELEIVRSLTRLQ